MKIATGYLIMPAGPCTVEKLKALWMNACFANATEKIDHEKSFDDLMAQLVGGSFRAGHNDEDWRDRLHQGCSRGTCLVGQPAGCIY